MIEHNTWWKVLIIMPDEECKFNIIAKKAKIAHSSIYQRLRELQKYELIFIKDIDKKYTAIMTEKGRKVKHHLLEVEQLLGGLKCL